MVGSSTTGSTTVDASSAWSSIVFVAMIVIVIVVVIVVVVVIVGGLGGLTRTAHTLGTAALRDRGAPTARLVAAAPLLELVGFVAGEDDRDVRRALAHPEVATACARLPRLAGRALVGPDAREVQLVGRQLAVVLGVGDGRVEQLRASVSAASFSQSCSTRIASSTGSPRTRSSTWRILYGETGRYRTVARALAVSSSTAISVAPSVLVRRGTGTCGWGRTRRACARPSPR